MEHQRNETSASPVALQRRPAALAAVQRMDDNGLLQPKAGAFANPADHLHHSPRMVAQRAQLAAAFGTGAPTAQRQGQDEEPLQGRSDPSAGTAAQAAPAENRTGLPNPLKAGVESLSGMSLDHVKVHYGSDKPAQLSALAYAQGSDIHLGPGQEQHLPHEAWHVVQQAQGRVKPTLQMAGGVDVNDDAGLEAEADTMGQKALATRPLTDPVPVAQRVAHAATAATSTVQRVVYPNMGAMWAVVHPGYALANIDADGVLAALYNDAAAQLPNCDFVQVPGTSPQASSTPLAAQPFRIDWDTAAALGLDNDYFASAIIHELAHAATSQQYRRNGVNHQQFIWANMNLPAAVGAVNPVTGMAPNQLASYQAQMQTIDRNWMDLEAEAQADLNSGALNAPQHGHIDGRIQYALATGFVHNDTVLGDMMYYLMAKNLADTRTYAFARRMLKEANDRRSNGFWSNADTEARTVDSRAWWFQFWKW
jgi:hypothetical protein